jgi:outer membrane protein assembly factor BamB
LRARRRRCARGWDRFPGRRANPRTPNRTAEQPPPIEARGPGWPQWGGPNRDFVVDATGLADTWPDAGPPVLWTRPLGPGHSAIVEAGGRLFTMVRAGDGRSRQGPFDAEESVIALDAATGRTLWQHTYPSRREDFSFGAGPHSTPLVVGQRLFTIGTNQQLHAFDTRTGKVLWAHDLIADFGSPELLIRPVVKAGYGCSPIAWRDTIICSVGGPGQSVMAFRQSDGAVVWKSGHFLTSAVAPILIELAGRTHLVVVGGGAVHGLDPDTGQVLWSHPHDPGNDLNCGTPLWGDGNILFLSSAYRAGSRAIRLVQDGGVTRTEELWFTNRVRFMFLNTVRLGDHVYGTTGDFGPAFLTALDIHTGQPAWQHRGFGRASLVHADGKAIIMDEDGDLALARLSPSGVTVLAEAKIFETTSWTAPTLVGTTLFARDREKIVALDLGDPAAPRGGVRNLLLRLPPIPPPPPPPQEGTVPMREMGTILSGTWRLDPSRSRVAEAGGLAGIPGGRGVETLHISQAANGALTVESQINAGHVRYYVAGGATTTPAGQSGTITMTTKWEGPALVSEGRQASDAGAATALTTVREVFTLDRADDTLRIDVTMTSAGETRTSALVYTRIDSVGACDTWPAPCKRAP